MKKVSIIICLFVFLFLLVGPVMAQLAEKQAELDRVLKYVQLLDKKIVAARNSRKINKLAELKEIKRKELARAKLLKAQIAALQSQGYGSQYPAVQPTTPVPAVQPTTPVPTAPLPAQPAAAAREASLVAMGGFGCGAGLIKVGYAIPSRNLDLGINGGGAVGNGFSVIVADVSVTMLFGRNFAGLELGMASYSKTVQNVPGISGTTEGGFGIGAFGGTNITDSISARVGYNSAMGLVALAGIKF